MEALKRIRRSLSGISSEQQAVTKQDQVHTRIITSDDGIQVSTSQKHDSSCSETVSNEPKVSSPSSSPSNSNLIAQNQYLVQTNVEKTGNQNLEESISVSSNSPEEKSVVEKTKNQSVYPSDTVENLDKKFENLEQSISERRIVEESIQPTSDASDFVVESAPLSEQVLSCSVDNLIDKSTKSAKLESSLTTSTNSEFTNNPDLVKSNLPDNTNFNKVFPTTTEDQVDFASQKTRQTAEDKYLDDIISRQNILEIQTDVKKNNEPQTNTVLLQERLDLLPQTTSFGVPDSDNSQSKVEFHTTDDVTDYSPSPQLEVANLSQLKQVPTSAESSFHTESKSKLVKSESGQTFEGEFEKATTQFSTEALEFSAQSRFESFSVSNQNKVEDQSFSQQEVEEDRPETEKNSSKAKQWTKKALKTSAFAIGAAAASVVVLPALGVGAIAVGTGKAVKSIKSKRESAYSKVETSDIFDLKDNSPEDSIEETFKTSVDASTEFSDPKEVSPEHHFEEKVKFSSAFEGTEESSNAPKVECEVIESSSKTLEETLITSKAIQPQSDFSKESSSNFDLESPRAEFELLADESSGPKSKPILDKSLIKSTQKPEQVAEKSKFEQVSSNFSVENPVPSETSSQTKIEKSDEVSEPEDSIDSIASEEEIKTEIKVDRTDSSTVPTESHIKPAEKKSTSVEKIQKVESIETAEPEVETTKTSIETDKPTVKTTKPSADTSELIVESAEHKIETTKLTEPEHKTDKPIVETAKSAAETSKPKVESTQSTVETANSEVKTVELEIERTELTTGTAKSTVETDKSIFETAEPEVETAESTFKTAKTFDDTENPTLETAEPEVETAEPAVETAKPIVALVEPKVETAESEFKTTEPAVETHQVETAKPTVASVEPKVETAESEVKTTEPKVETSKPTARSVEPQVGTAKPTFETAELECNAEIDKEILSETELSPSKVPAPEKVSAKFIESKEYSDEPGFESIGPNFQFRASEESEKVTAQLKFQDILAESKENLPENSTTPNKDSDENSANSQTNFESDISPISQEREYSKSGVPPPTAGTELADLRQSCQVKQKESQGVEPVWTGVDLEPDLATEETKTAVSKPLKSQETENTSFEHLSEAEKQNLIDKNFDDNQEVTYFFDQNQNDSDSADETNENFEQEIEENSVKTSSDKKGAKEWTKKALKASAFAIGAAAASVVVLPALGATAIAAGTGSAASAIAGSFAATSGATSGIAAATAATAVGQAG